MDKKTVKVFMICGYGCTLTEPYKRYLVKALQACRKVQPDVLLLSGGKTNFRTNPGKSEAGVMNTFFREECSQLFAELLPQTRIVLDEAPIMFRDAVDFLKEEFLKEGEIPEMYYFCLPSHWIKYKMHFAIQKYKSIYKGSAWPRSISQGLEWFKQTVFALPFEAFAYVSKRAYNKQVARRMNITNNS